MVMEVQKDMTAEGYVVRCIQKTIQFEKVLDYDYKRCIGCSICATLCPKKALQEGHLREIATGLDAPSILIDLDACAFCGMCVNFCPVGAFKMTIKEIYEPKEEESVSGVTDNIADQAVDFRRLKKYPKLISEAVPNEKCLPCSLCEPVCSTKAIKVSFDKTREGLGPLRKGIKGSINVDWDKCNLCGRCASFCKAFLLMEKEPIDPRNLKPFDQLLVDEKLCDYCGMCVSLCPEEAIKVEGEPLQQAEFSFAGKIEIDKGLCIGCGMCVRICPYQALEVKRPFEGEIRLIERNVLKCDPLGCHACFNVCPANCWYVNEVGGIGVVKDQCIFCGACAKACPKEVIVVNRTSIHHTPLEDMPWASEWKDAIASITLGEKKRPDVSTVVMPPEIERPPQTKIEMPTRDFELLRLTDEALKSVTPALKKPQVRYIMEREPPKQASQKIVEWIKKQRQELAKPEKVT